MPITFMSPNAGDTTTGKSRATMVPNFSSPMLAVCGVIVPFAVGPALAPAVLAVGGGSYGVLYTVAGVCAVLGAVAVLPVRRVR